MVFSIEITNTNSDVFRLQEAECKNASYSMITKFLKQSISDGDAEDTIIINLGREKNVGVPFTLRLTAGDAANGTHTSTVKTVQEKVDYLNETFITSGLEDLYTLNIYASAANILGIKGIIENFNLDFGAEKPNVLPGSLSFSVGGGSQ